MTTQGDPPDEIESGIEPPSKNPCGITPRLPGIESPAIRPLVTRLPVIGLPVIGLPGVGLL